MHCYIGYNMVLVYDILVQMEMIENNSDMFVEIFNQSGRTSI